MTPIIARAIAPDACEDGNGEALCLGGRPVGALPYAQAAPVAASSSASAMSTATTREIPGSGIVMPIS